MHPLRQVENESEKLRADLKEEILTGIQENANAQQRARAAYLAICLDLAPALVEEHPAEWRKAVAALNDYQQLVAYLLSGQPGTAAHSLLKERAASAGLVSLDK